MPKSVMIKLCLFVCLNFFFCNIVGCATGAVWKKRGHNKTTLIDETNAIAQGFYSECKDIGSFNNGIIIPFKSNKNAHQFPPLEEGYMVISSDKKAENIIQRIDEAQKAEDSNLSLAFLKANIWQTTDPDKNIKYWSGYRLGLKNRYGATTNYSTKGPHPGHIRSKDIKIKFMQKKETGAIGLNCKSLTEKPVHFDTTFSQGRLKYSEYENSRAFRTWVTPVSIIVDVITFPFQLIAFVTIPLWLDF